MPKEVILAVAFIATAAAWIRCFIVQRELQIYTILRETEKAREKAEEDYKKCTSQVTPYGVSPWYGRSP